MLAHPTGRRLLRERPRITAASLDMARLRALPEGTVGRVYADWLDREGVSPDTRAHVRYVDTSADGERDRWLLPRLLRRRSAEAGAEGGEGREAAGNAAYVAECAYAVQRYRESHDFYHALVGLPVVREGEVALKAFEFANTRQPMTGLAALTALSLKPAERSRFREVYGPWALRNGLRSEPVINIYWEEELGTDVGELRARLGIEAPPDLRAWRKRERDERRRRKEAEAAR